MSPGSAIPEPGAVSRQRRGLILAATLSAIRPSASVAADASPAEVRLAGLEQSVGGRLGVFAADTANGAEIRHRADERFPFCSTFKLILAGAVLDRSALDRGLLQKRIDYARGDLVTYSPITEKHLGTGMTVADLCAAALQYSDNTAANLLIHLVGGTAAVTAYARSIGNTSFRLDRWETDLNSAIPGDPRDTVTPAAMAASLRALVLGDALPPAQRGQLDDWLRGNTTGARRIRAGIPASWQVGDKTGSGDYGSANDIAVLRPPGRAPIVLAVYHTQTEPKAKWRDDVIAAAARIVVDVWMK